MTREQVPDPTTHATRILVNASRRRAKQILLGMRELPELDEARAGHELAVEAHDADATALWARVIWRILGARPGSSWLHERAGTGGFHVPQRQLARR